MDVDRETEKLARVLPKTMRLVNGPVPHAHYLQVVGRAKKIGHSGSSVFCLLLPAGGAELPTRRCLCGGDTSDWQRQWGDTGEDHQFPQ